MSDSSRLLYIALLIHGSMPNILLHTSFSIIPTSKFRLLPIKLHVVNPPWTEIFASEREIHKSVWIVSPFPQDFPLTLTNDRIVWLSILTRSSNMACWKIHDFSFGDEFLQLESFPCCFTNIYWLVVSPPLKKIWKSIGMTIPNIWKHRKCFKAPPTSLVRWCSVFESPWKPHVVSGFPDRFFCSSARGRGGHPGMRFSHNVGKPI